MTLKELTEITAKIGYPYAAHDKAGNLFIFRKKPTVHEESGGWMSSYSDRVMLHKVKFDRSEDWKESHTW